MNKTWTIVIILILIVLLAVIFWGGEDAEAPVDETDDTTTEVEDVDVTDDTSDDDTGDDDTTVREFTLNASNFQFDTDTITVNEGDTVRITLVNTEGFHDLVIDEFSVATPRIEVGESETIEFVADQTGEFEYYCSVGSHRDMGMVGTLIVE